MARSRLEPSKAWDHASAARKAPIDLFDIPDWLRCAVRSFIGVHGGGLGRATADEKFRLD